MFKRFLHFTDKLCKKSAFQRFAPIADALDTFCYEPIEVPTSPPFIRDTVDVKRWMMLVVLSLTPAVLFAIWNSGLQALVYQSQDPQLMEAFLHISGFRSYFSFATHSLGIFTILFQGCKIFFPLLFISYAVGGTCEVLFAIIRKHKIAEGLLVTGILYPLTLPPTIPYWMAALGIAFGVVVGKELFGGTGMNILNPALTGRAFLFFSFPTKMSGDIWVGSNAKGIRESLAVMNSGASKQAIDGFSQSTSLQIINSSPSAIKRVHVDAISSNLLNLKHVPTEAVLQDQLLIWKKTHPHIALNTMSIDQLQDFVTAPLAEGGLGLLPTYMDSVQPLSEITYGVGKFSTANLFWGNTLGALGETSVFACLLGALFLLLTGIASWRTMLSFGIGVFVTAWLFKLGNLWGTGKAAAWAPAYLFIPTYKHFLFGGLAFGLVFMATDPVSSPTMKAAKWIYGLFIGFVTMVIRLVNPAYPEGVMLAILLGNVFAPFFDYLAIQHYKKHRGM